MNVVVFYPGDEPFLGLWQPDADQPWQTYPVASGPGTANALLQTLERMLRDHKLQLQDISHVGTLTGPASYTQLRLFITTANTLAWSLDRPLFAIPPEAQLPDDLPHLIQTAHRNIPLEPIYKHEL